MHVKCLKGDNVCEQLILTGSCDFIWQNVIMHFVNKNN